MPRMPLFSSAARLALVIIAGFAARGAAQQSAAAPVRDDRLSQRIVATNPATYRPLKAVHAGAGNMAYAGLLDRGAIGPHFNFLHRGEIPAGSGIGHHFHNTADEMFVILNGEAQFTIDGRTAVVKGPVGVVCRAGHSHAIHNSGTEALQWINFQVSVIAGVSDAVDLGDDRVGVTLDRIPIFMTFKLDPALVRASAGRGGRGIPPSGAAPPATGVMTRRAAPPTAFASTWAYLDHTIVEPGKSIPATPHETIGEAYYVISGSGTVTVGNETAPIKKWDAVPVRLAETSSFTNTGSEPLEMIVYGVAKDMESKIAFMKGARRP